jgi:hypothetical protein
MRFRLGLLVVPGLLLGWSCSLKTNQPADGLAPDLGVSQDGVRPPDLSAAQDAGKRGNVGKPCEDNEACEGDATCLKVAQGVGMCAIPDCTTDPVDDCPIITWLSTRRRSVCTTLQVKRTGGGLQTVKYCLPECTASAERNTCAEINPALTCDPVTMLLNGHAEVCVAPACQSNTSCTNDPLHPGGTCDAKSQTCLEGGKVGVTVGSPCGDSTECGPGQFCLPQQVESDTGKVFLAGGYCTIIGCSHYGIWTCPSGSKCFLLGSNQAISLCLAVGCNPKANQGEPTGCRDNAPAGQYACTLFKDLDGSDNGVCWVPVK